MKKIGLFIFIFSVVLSGAFVFASTEASGRVLIQTEAVVSNETYYTENYVEWRYVCTAEIAFEYTAEGDQSTYSGQTHGTMESSSSCIEEIERTYAAGTILDIYYWNDDPSNYEFRNVDFGEAGMYNCCALFFGIFATVGIVMAFLGGGASTSMLTGGLSARPSGGQPNYSAAQGAQMNQQPASVMGMQSSYTSRNTGYLGYKERNYNSVIDRLRLHGSTPQQARSTVINADFMTPNQAEKFFNNPYVMQTLGHDNHSRAENTVSSSMKTPKKNFWTSATESALSSSDNDEECGFTGCSKKVNSFDFRCFECRKRFCDEHRGATFKCASCN